jgi:ectoine hydroxylase-related dioxygenase (phytanoyl-CoA dioxygenase family)
MTVILDFIELYNICHRLSKGISSMSITATETATPSLTVIYGDDRDRPLPEVQIFDNAKVTAESVIAALIKSGGCIIKNLLNAEELAAIEKDTRPYLDVDGTWEGSFFPKETHRVSALAEKSTSFMENIVGNKLYQKVCSSMLSSTITSWLGDKQKVSTSTPQVNATFVLAVSPGAHAQGMHRDSMVHHVQVTRKTAEEYEIGQDPEIGIFVAGKKTTRANGATRFIPGSHLWGPNTPPDEKLAFYAELDPGDCFFMLASSLHGGSANTTEDEERLIYCAFMTKGFLRQVLRPLPLCLPAVMALIMYSREENQYLTNNQQKIKEIQSPAMLKLLGYDLSRPFLGWIQTGNPMTALTGSTQKGPLAKNDYY